MTRQIRFVVPRRLLAGVFAAGWLSFGVAGSASAQDIKEVGSTLAPIQAPPVRPEDPTAAKAYAVFERACASCHQAGRLQSLPSPAKAFGNILDLDALARDGTRVRPGSADGSKLYTLMQGRTSPHDLGADGKPIDISGDDLAAVRDWIQGLNPARGCPERPRLTRGFIADATEQALAAAPDAGKTIRFLSLAHHYNACAPADDLAMYRQGATLAVNSLSWGLKPVALEAVDPTGVILKVDLSAIGWDAARWDRLVTGYPYALSDALGPPSASTAGGAITTHLVRADWFAATALRAPLYYELLGLPDKAATLYQSLRSDPLVDAQQGKARRAGIRSSTVARGSRLFQRGVFANGALWQSWEYAATSGRNDLFDAPGGPGSRGAPKPDAQMTMFSLPSGFNAFFIANGEGQRVNDLPTSVLRNDAHPAVRVTAGAACLACHDQGTRAVTDQLRQHVAGDTSVPRDIRDRVAAMHVPFDEFAKLLAEDNQRVVNAMTVAGLTPGLRRDGLDPVSMLIARYEQPVTLDRLAAELVVEPPEIAALVGRIKGPAGELTERLLHGTVSRRLIETSSTTIASELQQTAAPGPARKPTVEELLAMSTNPVVERSDGFELILKTGPAVYRSGDSFAVRARATESCYLTLINVDRSGRGTVVFPNDFDQNNFIEAGKELKVPADGAPYLFRLREFGRETVVGICSTTNKVPPGISHDFERQRFTELGDYRSFLTRTFGNAADGKAITPPADPRAPRRRGGTTARTPAGTAAAPSPTGPEQQARAAVQIEVK